MAEEQIKIVVNLDALTIGDLEEIDEAVRGDDVPIKRMIDILDRIVDGDIRALPLSSLRDIMAAVRDEMAEASNPKN